MKTLKTLAIAASIVALSAPVFAQKVTNDSIQVTNSSSVCPAGGMRAPWEW